MAKELKTIGAFEKVNFPEFGIKNVIAKIDTGAYNGALHATNMIRVSRADGKTELVFHPLGNNKFEARTVKYRKLRVTSSNGIITSRYFIETIVEIEGRQYPISITLTNRSRMRKEVLIGRKFLRRNNFIVDVKKGTQYAVAGKVKPIK